MNEDKPLRIEPLPNWRDLPENHRQDDPLRGWSWLDTLANQWECDPDGFHRALYWVLRKPLDDTGLSVLDASRIALRQTREAWLLRKQYDQAESARLLATSRSTVKGDVRRVREAVQSGRLDEVDSRRLPPIPIRADDRVKIDAPPARPRRRRR